MLLEATKAVPLSILDSPFPKITMEGSRREGVSRLCNSTLLYLTREEIILYRTSLFHHEPPLLLSSQSLPGTRRCFSVW